MISTDLVHEVSRDTKAEHDDLDPERDVRFQLGRQTRVSWETPAVAAARDGMCSPTKRKREKSRGGEGRGKITHETWRKKETESVWGVSHVDEEREQERDKDRKGERERERE